LQKDDFVVDDGVGGYMDNGMDDWTGGSEGADGEGAADSDGEDYGRKKKCTPRVRLSGND
jgi:DNA polymerase alpha subunit A